MHILGTYICMFSKTINTQHDLIVENLHILFGVSAKYQTYEFPK